jgi:hypothetical protein
MGNCCRGSLRCNEGPELVENFHDIARGAELFDSRSRHFPTGTKWSNFETTPAGTMGKREPQIILKPDERSIHLELGREEKFVAKSGSWDENRVSSSAWSIH